MENEKSPERAANTPEAQDYQVSAPTISHSDVAAQYTGITSGSEQDERDLTEATNVTIAARMARQFRDRLCYVHSTDKVSAVDRAAGWVHYTNGRWTRERSDSMALDAVETTIRAMLTEVSQSERDSTKLQERQRALLNALNRTPSIRTVAAAKMSRNIREFDANPYILNVLNGTLELGSTENPVVTLREHRPEDFCLMQAQANYRPEATCPRYDQFLREVLPDEETAGYVNRAMGYTLLGDNHKHALFLCYGSGRNGKNTLLETALSLLGGYGGLLSPDLLISDLARTGTSLLPEVVALRSTRFTLSSEPKKGVLNGARMKSWTGDAEIEVRMLYGDPERMPVTFTLWIMTNHLPDLNEHNPAVEGRIHVIPFPVDFTGREEDGLKAKLWTERDGILATWLRGLTEFRQKGLTQPQTVKQAASDWYSAEHSFNRLFDTLLVRQSDSRILFRDFRNAVAHYIDEAEDIPENVTADPKTLDAILRHFGLMKRTRGGQAYIYDVKLRAEDEVTDQVHDGDEMTVEQKIYFTLRAEEQEIEGPAEMLGVEIAQVAELNEGTIYVALKRLKARNVITRGLRGSGYRTLAVPLTDMTPETRAWLVDTMLLDARQRLRNADPGTSLYVDRLTDGYFFLSDCRDVQDDVRERAAAHGLTATGGRGSVRVSLTGA